MSMKLTFLFLMLLVSSMLFSCAQEEDDDEDATTDLTISGTLATTSGKTSLVTSEAISDYTVYCVTFEIPPVAGTGTVGSSGAFTLTLAEGKDKPFGCFILDDANAVVATLVVEDSDASGLSGSSEQQSQIALAGNATLGTVTLDLERGVAIVDKAQIASEIADAPAVDAGDLFDFTGTWEFSPATLTDEESLVYDALPASNQCDMGPCDGMQLFMKRIQAVTYENGAATDTPVYGIQMWNNETIFENCGSKTGVTVAEGQEFGVDFTNLLPSDITAGAFEWDVDWTDGWIRDGAVAAYDVYYFNGTEFVDGGIDQGQACGNGTTHASAVCHSQTIWDQLEAAAAANKCVRRMHFNWQASNLQNFINQNGAPKPEGMIAFEKLNYTSANTASFRWSEEYGRGFQDTGDVDSDNTTPWIDCRIVEDISVGFTSTSTTTMVGEISMKTKVIRNNQTDAVYNFCLDQAGDSDIRYKINMEKVTP